MDIKELRKLKEKREQFFSEKSEELKRLEEELDKKAAELENAYISGSDKEQDRIQDEWLRLQYKVQGLQKAVGKIRQQKAAYTDQDVLKGYAEYAKTYNAKASALKKKYDSGMETAYKAMMENVELRRAGIAAHDEFKKYLENQDAPMAKLDTIPVDPRQAQSIFKDLLNSDGIDWTELVNRAIIANDNRY